MTAMQSPTLTRVLKGQLCSGCGLCKALAPDSVEMHTVAPGYSRPRQFGPIGATAEEAIAQSCPGSKVAPWHEAPHSDPYWGPYYQVLTGHAVDPRVRFAGASGGGITALAIHALETGLVDAVLQIGADPEQPTRNQTRLVDTVDDLIANAGSRYAASSPLAEIEAVLNQDRRIALIGKPCDVSAMRQLAHLDSRVNQKIPLMLSFFCAGVPSHAGADRILDAMELADAPLSSFRYRGNGWPGLTRAETRDGRFGEMRYADSWGKHLSREVQFRCKLCPDGVGGVADIACADAWYGGETGYPTFEELDGRSLMMSRTATGEHLLESAINAGRVVVEDVPIGDVALMQPGQSRRKRVLRARRAACMVTGQPVPDTTGLRVSEAAQDASVRDQMREFLGTARRVVMGKR